VVGENIVLNEEGENNKQSCVDLKLPLSMIATKCHQTPPPQKTSCIYLLFVITL